jgi:hypothetical protein
MTLVVFCLAAEVAAAQFTRPITPPQLPSPVQPSAAAAAAGNNSARTIQQIMMLRYLQQRSGGGVKRGVPQFIPFGNQGGFLPQGMPMQQDATQAVDTDKKSNEDKKAEYQAAREAKKKAAQARAEKRKAARAKGTSASRSKNPA